MTWLLTLSTFLAALGLAVATAATRWAEGQDR